MAKLAFISIFILVVPHQIIDNFLLYVAAKVNLEKQKNTSLNQTVNTAVLCRYPLIRRAMT